MMVPVPGRETSGIRPRGTSDNGAYVWGGCGAGAPIIDRVRSGRRRAGRAHVGHFRRDPGAAIHGREPRRAGVAAVSRHPRTCHPMPGAAAQEALATGAAGASAVVAGSARHRGPRGRPEAPITIRARASAATRTNQLRCTSAMIGRRDDHPIGSRRDGIEGAGLPARSRVGCRRTGDPCPQFPLAPMPNKGHSPSSRSIGQGAHAAAMAHDWRRQESLMRASVSHGPHSCWGPRR